MRLILIALVALGLAPGTWLRTPSPVDNSDILWIEPIASGLARAGELEMLGVWHLTSPNTSFGSYSALVPLGKGRLMAGSDRGARLTFSVPGAREPKPRFGRWGDAGVWNKQLADLEALARDPKTGQIWAAYERSNSIMRYDRNFASSAKVFPQAMQNWPSNSGPESMVRLRDGWFIVIAEGAREWFGDVFPALLFLSDPVAGAEPVQFGFAAPEGYRPVDMAQLPDGRVLILLRGLVWGIPPGFAGKIVVADPAEIEAGEVWRGRTIAALEAPLPTDNYEGIAVEPAADGAVILWVISDDNGSRSQRTLLLKLRWHPEQIREAARR